MRVCVYCKTRYQTGSGVTFHKFPTDSTTQKLWLRNMKFGNWFPHISSHLCSKHFTEDCFIRHFSRTQLKKDSVPTIFSDLGIMPEANREGEADLMNYECIENQVDGMNLETMSEPSTSYNNKLNKTPKRKRSYSEICENINHDHRYENTPRSSKRVMQRIQKTLRRSQTRVKTLSQHVKRLKISVSSLKTVISELEKKKLATDDCVYILHSK